MAWIVVSVIIVVVSVVLVAAAARRQSEQTTRPAGTLTPRVEDSIATRIRRLEDDTADLAAQVTELREDVQYLMRQLEDRP
jgi:hypothetical protein